MDGDGCDDGDKGATGALLAWFWLSGRNLATGESAPGEGERLRFSRGCFGSDRESAKGTPDEAQEGGVASIGDD